MKAQSVTSEYYMGPNLLVALVLSRVTQRSVYLPERDWIDYWSGQQLKGKQTIAVNAPLDRVPLYVRAGAILPKIPDDIMTLVPASEVANKNVKSLDDRRLYEMYSGNAKVSMRDFEDRALDRDGNSFTIAGKATHVILPWRFNAPRSVSVAGRVSPYQRRERRTHGRVRASRKKRRSLGIDGI